LRYLTIRILYPKPGKTAAILEAIGKVSEAARKFEGIVEIGAWLDKENDRIVSMTLWETKEHAARSTREMHANFADIPWTDWDVNRRKISSD
jgi:heme-degrading monooxygenase HmoA